MDRTNCPICNKNHKTYPSKCEKDANKSKNTELHKKMTEYLKQFKPLLELLR
jgi:hypothetical protein